MSGSGFKAYMLAGPTASGKSAAAHWIARRDGVPLISCDSMNIYCGMDIGTAKPTPAERMEVEYAGFDLVQPEDKFNVGNYLEAVRPAFAKAQRAGCVPIVAGGTGLYVKCLLQGLDEVPPELPELRARLEQLPVAELQQELERRDPARYAKLADRENPRRLIRAIELDESGAAVPECWDRADLPVIAGLHVERALLHERIAVRVDRMYAEGLLDEARTLAGRELSSTALQAIGYAEAFAVLRGEMSEAEAKEKTVIRTRQLAKRQLTWLRNQLNVEWVDVTSADTAETVARKVLAVWEHNGASKLGF